MTQRTVNPGAHHRPWRHVPMAALAVLAAIGTAGPVGAHKPGASAPPADAVAASPPAAGQYNIVPLSDDRLAFEADINASGQVSFTELFELPDPGTYRVRFYDGRDVRTISPFGVTSFASGLNDRGQVTGTIGQSAFRWSRKRGLVYLTGSGTGGAAGLDINDSGEVVGAATFAASGDAPHAARWSTRSLAQDLGTLGGPTSVAFANNDAGTVAGWSDVSPSARLPFRWTHAGGMQALGSFPSATAQAWDVNADGWIVGAVPFRQGGPDRAFLWTPRNGLIDLGTGGQASEALRINDRGMVIGNVNNLPAYFRGFVWTRETGPVEIGAPADDSQATDLNNGGQVVGSVAGRAFVWTRAAGTIDLNTRVRNVPSGLVLNRAVAINDAGTIVANTNTGLVLLTRQAVSGLRPLVGAIQVPDAPRAGTLLSFSASFTDVDPRETHTATWDWGDGAAQPGIVTERNGSGTVSGQHTFGEGEFTIRLTVTDSCGKRTTVRWDLIVLPASDFIAGQGTFISPPGAAGHAAAWSGMARFAFMSPPAGDRHARSKTLVRFDMAGMRFRSGRIDSLETLGAQVRYRGSGSLNGVQGYRFMLAATRTGGAGSALDRVHVRLWHRDPRTGAEIVDYDNARGGGAAPTGGTRLLVEGTTGTAGFD